MATMYVQKRVENLGEIIVNVLRSSGGGSRDIRDIEDLLDHEHGYDLCYSGKELYAALEELVHDGLHLDKMLYHLMIKIRPRWWRKPEVRFWLLGIPDEKKSEEDPDPVDAAVSVMVHNPISS